LTAASPLMATNGVEATALFQAGYFVRTKRIDSGIVFEDGWQTVDKVLHPDTLEFYSSKPPLLSVLVAGLYWLLQKLTGLTLANNPMAVVRIILLLVNGGLFLIYLRLMMKLVDRFGRSDWAKFFVLAATCFATLVTAFTNTLNNHTLATFCLVF